MEYTIQITGMHCAGCQNLIKLVLEDLGFTDISVSLAENTATFRTTQPTTEITQQLNKSFATELKNYNYTNLAVI